MLSVKARLHFTSRKRWSSQRIAGPSQRFWPISQRYCSISEAPGPMSKRMSEDDWVALEWEVRQLFDGAPIDEEDLFAGRQTEVHRMLESVLERSKHVVLYGEKGVGKTSLSNVFWKR